MKNVSSKPVICIDCSLEAARTSNRQLRCISCQFLRDKEHCKDRYKKTYVKKGYTRKGVLHNRYKNGASLYKKSLKDACEFCDTQRVNLCVHHIDENRANNVEDNLITLCRSCHVLVHAHPRDNKGRFTKTKEN